MVAPDARPCGKILTLSLPARKFLSRARQSLILLQTTMIASTTTLRLLMHRKESTPRGNLEKVMPTPQITINTGPKEVTTMLLTPASSLNSCHAGKSGLLSPMLICADWLPSCCRRPSTKDLRLTTRRRWLRSVTMARLLQSNLWSHLRRRLLTHLQRRLNPLRLNQSLLRHCLLHRSRRKVVRSLRHLCPEPERLLKFRFPPNCLLYPTRIFRQRPPLPFLRHGLPLHLRPQYLGRLLVHLLGLSLLRLLEPHLVRLLGLLLLRSPKSLLIQPLEHRPVLPRGFLFVRLLSSRRLSRRAPIPLSPLQPLVP